MGRCGGANILLSRSRIWSSSIVRQLQHFSQQLLEVINSTFLKVCAPHALNFRDCIVTTAVNCFTSFFSGFVIFTYLGFMSHKQGVHISTVATEGKFKFITLGINV